MNHASTYDAAKTSLTTGPIDRTLAVQRVIGAYRDPVIRAYSWGRFKIFRQRFLEEIGQYIPARGQVLDIGCGFGLFALYYAQTHPQITLSGFDMNEKRVAVANGTAAELGITNANFQVRNARDLEAGSTRFDAIYMLDVIHHVPFEEVAGLLRTVRKILSPGGVLLIKDLDTKPTWQRLFSHALDLAMSPDSPPRYWSTRELVELLEATGFSVKLHAMVDILPYPHVLYIARPV